MNYHNNIVTLSANETVRLSEVTALVYGIPTTSVLSNISINCLGGNCALIFDGIKLMSCTIEANHTTFVFENICHTFENLTLNGDVICNCLFPELFGAVGNGDLQNEDLRNNDTTALQECFDKAVQWKIFNVKFLPRTYLIRDTLYYKGNLNLEGTYHSDNYNVKDCTCILANLQEGTPFSDYDEFGIEYVKFNPNLKFALDSDCYMCDETAQSPSFCRVPVYESVSNKTLYFSDSLNDRAISVPSIHIKNIILKTENDSFGGIRSMGMVNSSIEGVLIDGFRVGMMLHKGWNFVVLRVQIKASMVGLAMYNKITCGLFESVQITHKASNETEEDREKAFALYPRDQSDDNTLNPNRRFMNTFVKGRNDSVYHSIYDNEYETDSTTPIGEDIKTVAISANYVKATFNSCTMEKFDMGIVGWNDDLVFNSPYVETIKLTIVFIRNGYTLMNNMIGNQEPSQSYSYIVPDFNSRIVLNHCHPGTFYPTFRHSYPDYESRNRKKYNFKSYIVTHHDKINRPFIYDSTSYLDYDVGDTVFVADNVENDNVNWGDYIQRPISLATAIDRIANDYNYRHVKYIVLSSSIALNSTKTWTSPQNELILLPGPQSYSLTFNAKQDINVNLRCEGFQIRFSSSLFRVFGKSQITMAFNDIVFTKLGTDNCHFIENVGVKPADKCLCECVMINTANDIPLDTIVSDNWHQAGFSTKFIVEQNNSITIY